MYFNQSSLLTVIFFLSSAHKRFTELLSKEEKELPNTRLPMEKILTLPELKVKSGVIVNHKNKVLFFVA